jgi:hypothetical protein
VPRHRLEDRIRSLSKKLVEAEGKEFQRLAIELGTAISEYVERFRTRSSQYPWVHSRRFDDRGMYREQSSCEGHTSPLVPPTP